MDPAQLWVSRVQTGQGRKDLINILREWLDILQPRHSLNVPSEGYIHNMIKGQDIVIAPLHH